MLTFAAVAQIVGDTDSIKWTALIFGLLGGLAIFLIGMEMMTEALRLIVGGKARAVIEKLTSNRFMGLLTGAGITAVVQSSSVTTVLVVGFISAGLMSFVESIPVILGSNIGTTITAQVIAFNVTTWALALVAGGFLLTQLAKREKRRAQGAAIVGLGLVFFGMVVMGEAMSPLRTYEPFINAMESLDNLFLAILVGAIFTALVQSSSATTGIVIVLASQGLISLEAGVGLIMGANIGTSVTALLAAIGKPRDAQRAAVAHLVFNVMGVLIWLPFLGLLVSWVESIGGGTSREVANAHTIFNVVNALIFLPFVTQFAALIIRIVPDKPQVGVIAPKYIDTGLLRTPDIALAKARMEILRMASRVQGMLVEFLPAILDGDIDTMADVEGRDDEVDELHGLVLEYLGRISQEKLSEDSSAELVDLLEATNALEAIGDLVETNLIALGYEKIEASVTVSRETRSLIERYHQLVVEAFEMALVAVIQKDQGAARTVTGMKREIRSLEDEIMAHQNERLVADEPNRVATYRFELDLVTNLKRVYYFARRIARAAVPEHEQAGM
ncbi:MAG: Na/Pi cotransporter family protein [Actinomycetia bacterium]|nr:Na/Pi cotransporter family protein [Actinomycetes bacterium]